MDEKQKIENTDKIEDTEKADNLESEAHKDKVAENSSGGVSITATDVERIVDNKISKFLDTLNLHKEPDGDESGESDKSLNTEW